MEANILLSKYSRWISKNNLENIIKYFLHVPIHENFPVNFLKKIGPLINDEFCTKIQSRRSQGKKQVQFGLLRLDSEAEKCCVFGHA